jgi:hypothetical protein
MLLEEMQGKKCRCTPLQAKCPGPNSDHVGCLSGGTPGCLTLGKPQCGPVELRCLLRVDDPCEDDCDCAIDLLLAAMRVRITDDRLLLPERRLQEFRWNVLGQHPVL